MRARRRLKVLANKAEQVSAVLDKAVDKLEPMSCSKGCSACCRQLVSVTRAEGALIVDRHREKVTAARDKLEHQARVAEECFHGMEGDVLETVPEAALSYWKRQINCAFLTEDQECGIYDARPLECRAYFVTSSPELCKTLEGRSVTLDGERVLSFELLRFESQVFRTSTIGTLPAVVLNLLGKM